MPTIALKETTLPKLTLPPGKAQEYYWDEKLSGFGVVVGARAKTFVARSWVGGKKRRVKIGIAGRPREDGLTWNVKLARQRAHELLAEMQEGRDPNAEKRARRGGPSLRDGLRRHVSNMRKRGRSERSIATLESEVTRLMADWLDRPIVELRGRDLAALHDELTEAGKLRLADKIAAHVSACWNALDREHELPGRNPARAVVKHGYRPSRERVDDLAEWYRRVKTLSPIRHDFQLVVMFTGMRSEAARHMRWEHIDFKTGALHVPAPKGGRAFKLPLPQTCIDALQRRRKGNAEEFAGLGGDQGWCFPSLSRSRPHKVIPMQEAKERRKAENGRREQYLPGPHVLRRTYLSIAAEAGISELDRHVLANHSYSSANINAIYISQSWEHLRECQARIEEKLLKRMRAKNSKGGQDGR